MKEEHCSNNLQDKSLCFLETRVFPSWNETVIALRSGDKSLDKLANVGLVDLFLDSLVEKASYDPRLLGEPAQNREGNDEYRPNPRRRLFVIDWKSEDLITVPLRFYEDLMIRAIKSRNIPAEYIVSSVCKFAKKWVFESVSGKAVETVEAVERLLPHQRGTVSCEFLFESLKHSIRLEASTECRNGFEVRISKQLDLAKPTDFKILTRGGYGENAQSFEDIALLKAIIMRFYSNYAADDDEDSEENVSLRFAKVPKVLEEFLYLAASEASLKLKAFVELAEITVATSQGISSYSDGIYKAIDVFLESHIHLTETEKMEACKVLDVKKLSQEGCEKAAKNQRLPLRVVVNVLSVSQLRIRDSVAEKRIEDDDEIETMSNKLLGVEIEKKKKKKRSVWREVKRKFGCLTSPSTCLVACTCNVIKKKKKIHH